MKKLLILLSFCLFSQVISAQNTVEVNLDVKHILGEVETFDRKKFISLHSSLTERDWDGDNVSPDLKDEFLNGYDVSFGRNTGGISWYLKNRITEDPNRPGFADSTSIKNFGTTTRNGYGNQTNLHPYEGRKDLIIATQLHPFYPDGQTTNLNWAFSQADTEDEPFGTASGEFYGRYIRDFFGSGGQSGEPTPSYCEIVNEPLWDLVTNGTEDPARIFNFHKTVAQQVRKFNPDVPIGGYCAAFPDFDKDNFNRWHERWKLFVDIAGEEMDYWTIHLYDFPSINNGRELYRKGSNMEATMDMIEQYSYLSFGEVKPMMISEYGAQTHDYNRLPWSPYRDWLKTKSTNSMVMQFMERANNINKTLPFIVNKAEWGFNSTANVPYPSRLMRKENEPNSNTGRWVYTDKVQFFQLWSDVKGTRVDSKSNNLDFLVDAFVEDNKAYLIVNNLEFTPLNFKPQLKGIAATPSNIEVRHNYLDGLRGTGSSRLDITNLNEVPEEVEIGGEGTMVFLFTFDENIVIDKTSEEQKYYADTYLQEIVRDQAMTFRLDGVSKETYGEAILRVGVGRDHGRELQPTVRFNGQEIMVPNNHRGGPQTDRDNFFGVLEIPVPFDLLQTNNEVIISYPDQGGFVSTVTLQVFNFSHNIRERTVSTNGREQQNDFFSVYPNPTRDLIRVTSSEPIHSITILDIKGRELRKLSNSAEINVSDLPVGTYLISVTGANHFGIAKFSKMN